MVSSTIQAELDEIASSVASVSKRFPLDISRVGDNDAINKITQAEEISLFGRIGTPGARHDVEQVMEEAMTIFDYRMRMNHPRFMAFIPSFASPLSWLGESLTSAFNTFAGSKLEGSGPSVIENTLLEWLASRVGLPSTAGGVFVSGGSVANLTALAVARDRILPREKHPLGVAYLSDQAHSSNAKALRILGFGKDQIRICPSNSKFQLEPNTLSSAIAADRAAGLLPFVVIASCGTTNTGSIDPLHALAEVCRRENIWMHVDGAFGATASLAATRSAVVKGLELADSLSWDGHKWLFQTYGCGLLLVRDKQHLMDSFATDAEYLRDAAQEDDVPNFWNYGIEQTRPARAMKMWFTLRVLGVDLLGRMIDQGFALAERAEQELRKLPDWEITSPATMAILTFRFAPPSIPADHLDALNEAISKKLTEENIAGIITTEVKGHVVLRICSLNPSFTEEQMAAVITDVNNGSLKVLEEYRAMTGEEQGASLPVGGIKNGHFSKGKVSVQR